ncbi:histidinol-phosphate transaminase [Clostridium sp. LP20]|uniref:histidinol-phosphate transaminase n=1 Tax=Clostridium sp. LP20 TaxID=3418665 RepID=UPI003EE59BBC
MKGVNSYINIEQNSEIALNANESYVGMGNDVLMKIKSALDEVDLNRYPEDSSREIKKAYAKYAEVSEKNIIVGHGSDEMLGLIIASTITEGKKLLTLSPDFSMYDYYVSMNGGEVVKYKTDTDGSFKVEDFIELGKKENVDLVMFSNPNNPTGYALNCEEMVKILEAFEDKYVVVDEAYYEFNGETMMPYINEYENLLVTRTLSKAWGLAALRVGFLLSNEGVIEKFNKYKVPYNVNSLSQTVATIVVEKPEIVKRNIELIVEGREFLYKELKKIEEEASLKVEFYKSKANYIFGRTPYKEALLKKLKASGIIIRNFNDDSFRVSVGSPFENKKLIENFKEVFIYGGKEKWQIEVLA